MTNKYYTLITREGLFLAELAEIQVLCHYLGSEPSAYEASKQPVFTMLGTKAKKFSSVQDAKDCTFNINQELLILEIDNTRDQS